MCEHIEACVAAGQLAMQRDNCPWVAVAVWGCNDSPVAWNCTPQPTGALGGGDNDYVMLMLPMGQYVVFAVGDGFCSFP